MEPSIKNKALHILDLLHQQLIAVFFLLILWEVFKNNTASSISAWHIVLCVFGFAVCGVEALIIFNKDGILKGIDRVTRGKWHAGVMFLGCLSITAGVALKIYQKDDAGRSHFTSTHGRLGLSAWILVLITVIGGPLAMYSKHLTSIARPIWFKGLHIIIGLGAYIVGIVTLGYGLDHLSSLTGENGRIALLVFLILNVLYSLVGPALTLVNLVTR